jgi:hypothetical protein
MADSLGTNPMVVDLTSATARSIKTGDVYIGAVVLDTLPAAAANRIQITHGNGGAIAWSYSATQAVLFEHINDWVGATVRDPWITISAAQGTASVLLISDGST